MRHPLLVGSLGAFASLTLNEAAALVVSAVTVLALLPVVFTRWKKFLRGDDPLE